MLHSQCPFTKAHDLCRKLTHRFMAIRYQFVGSLGNFQAHNINPSVDRQVNPLREILPRMDIGGVKLRGRRLLPGRASFYETLFHFLFNVEINLSRNCRLILQSQFRIDFCQHAIFTFGNWLHSRTTQPCFLELPTIDSKE